jgi:hypothetical protein
MTERVPVADWRKLVDEAREACRCVQCQGYPIGAYTIQMRPGETRPTSCLAAVVLAEMANGDG